MIRGYLSANLHFNQIGIVCNNLLNIQEQLTSLIFHKALDSPFGANPRSGPALCKTGSSARELLQNRVRTFPSGLFLEAADHPDNRGLCPSDPFHEWYSRRNRAMPHPSGPPTAPYCRPDTIVSHPSGPFPAQCCHPDIEGFYPIGLFLSGCFHPHKTTTAPSDLFLEQTAKRPPARHKLS